MMLGPLSRVMMVRQPFCEKNMQNSNFLCATFSPARAVAYFYLTWALLWSNRTAQPAVVLNCCAVLLDHNNARFSWKYRTAHVFCTTWLSDHQRPNVTIWSHVLCQVHHPFKPMFSLGPAPRPGQVMVLMCLFVRLFVCLSPQQQPGPERVVGHAF